MLDEKLSKRLKGKVISTCVIPACIRGVRTLALTGDQQAGFRFVRITGSEESREQKRWIKDYWQM